MGTKDQRWWKFAGVREDGSEGKAGEMISEALCEARIDIPYGDVVVLCDFDGTISNVKTLGLLFREFAASGMEYVRQWERGEIDMREEIRGTFSTVKASKKDMEKTLDKVEIDPGFLEFLEFGREEGYFFSVVSDGLDWYIEYILSRYGVNSMPIFANQIIFEQKGFRFEFPWYDEETPRRGVCKSKIARAYRERFNKVVFVGDGRSDIDVVKEVDQVYARSWLAGYCYAKGLDAVEFNDWRDLKRKWKQSQHQE